MTDNGRLSIARWGCHRVAKSEISPGNQFGFSFIEEIRLKEEDMSYHSANKLGSRTLQLSAGLALVLVSVLLGGTQSVFAQNPPDPRVNVHLNQNVVDALK